MKQKLPGKTRNAIKWDKKEAILNWTANITQENLLLLKFFQWQSPFKTVYKLLQEVDTVGNIPYNRLEKSSEMYYLAEISPMECSNWEKQLQIPREKGEKSKSAGSIIYDKEPTI